MVHLKRPTVSICHARSVGDKGQAYAAIVRSTVAHGFIKDIDTHTAREMPGVLGVWTGVDLQLAGDGPLEKVLPPVGDGCAAAAVPAHGSLATDKVYFAGQPVAIVIAVSQAEAKSAADAIRLDIEALPALTDPRDSALFSSPQIFSSVPGNICTRYYAGDYDKTTRAFDKAAHVTRLRFVDRWSTVATMRLHHMVGLYDPSSNRCVLYAGLTADGSGRDERRVQKWNHERISARIDLECGGLIQISELLRRPIEWVVHDWEALPDDGDQYDYDFEWELALDRDGRFLAVRQVGFVGVGAFILKPMPSLDPVETARSFATLYRTPLVEASCKFVFTNTTPQCRFSDPVGPAAHYAVERLIDAAAREMRIDPVELRQRNLVQPEEAATTCGAGAANARGAFARWLARAAELADLEGFAVRKAESAAHDRLRGLGIGNYLSAGTSPAYPDGTHVAEVEVDPNTGAFAIVKYTAVGDFGTTCSDGGGVYTGEVSRTDACPAVMNALVDALGGKQIDTPISPYRVWQALNPSPPMLGLN